MVGGGGDRAVRALGPARRTRFLAATGDGRWGVVSALRRLVEFRAPNPAEVAWSVEGPFDVIVCRNVVMYLDASHRYAVLERMASLLEPDGLLILDPAEHLGAARVPFGPGADGVYARRRGPRRPPGGAPMVTPARR